MKTTKYILTLITVMIMTVGNAWGAITPTTPSKDASGVYQIGTAEELWGFAQGVNNGTIAVSANAKLTCETSIDLGGSANGSFPGIGSSSKVYTGTFDGNGKTITGYYLNCTTNTQGFFPSVSTNAVIKDFTINGTLDVTGTGAKHFVGAVVGRADGKAIVQDVTSNVNINVNGQVRSGMGGVVGCTYNNPAAMINRCRYSGTITVSAYSTDKTNPQGVGGICGNHRSGTVQNCLFDGTIVTTINDVSESTTGILNVGGIIGCVTDNGTVYTKNCFANGTMTIKDNTYNHCGIFIGWTKKNTNDTNCYYTNDKVSVTTGSMDIFGTITGSSTTGTPQIVTNTSDLTNGTLKANLNNGDNNWKQGTNYPIPGVESTYTITFESDGGSAVASITTTAGASVPAPTAPTKTGYDYAGWVDSERNAVTFPYTMPAGNVTLTATWTLATFHVNYYVDNALYQSVPVKYTEAIPPLDAPIKERYTFSGWSTIPANMPAEDVRVDGTFTYTANAEDIYEIGTKEDFFNFADVANETPTAKGKLIADINLNEESFSGIGSLSKPYTGEFDGDGHTISGFKRTGLTGTGNALFNSVNGGTVKKFTISGSMTLAHTSNSSYYNAGAVGYAYNGALVEDVTSYVNITCTTSQSRLVAGVVGRLNGETTKINRCRYNGTINAGDTYDQVAGICADIQGGGIIQNCLFDGKIISTSTNAGLYIGGIVAWQHNGNINVSNNLANGTITLAEGATTTNSGLVYGNLATTNTLTASVNYYAVAGSKIGTTDFTQGYGTTKSGSTNTTTFVDSTPWLDICVALNAGSSNWGLDLEKQVYPVPGASAPTNYTLTFNTDGGTEVAAITQPEGSAITAPENPTKTGYTFNGWNPAIPATMPNGGLTITAQWTINQHTITFDTKGGTTIKPIVQDYNTAVTAPANPEKTGYVFAGWDKTIPTTMPDEDVTITAQWTYTPVDGVCLIGTQEDLFNFAAYVNRNDLGQDNGRGSVDAKLIADITLDGTPFPGIGQYKTKVTDDKTKESYYHYTSEGKWVDVTGGTLNGDSYTFKDKTTVKAYAGHATGAIGDKPTNPEADKVYCVTDYVPYLDPSYAYTGTFDGQGHAITGYVRNINTNTNQGGMFNYVKDATIRNFSLAGTMTINGTAQQYGSVVGCSAGNTLVEDVYSSVDVTISSNAAQVGGFVGRAGGTYNRCRYSGKVSSETAYNKIGGFAGNITAGTLTNCLFDGTISLSANNAALMSSAFVASSFGDNPHVIKNCLVKGTMTISHPTDSCGIVVGYYEQALTVDRTYYTGSGRSITGAKGTLTGQATPVGSLTMVQLRDALNPTEGTDGNWEIKAEQQYPVPSKCTKAEHVHEYINGFCIAGDSYEEATKAQDGWYEIANAGQLWWIAKRLNRVTVNGSDTLALKTRIRLTDNINMDGETHGQFPGICPLGNKRVEGQVQLVDDWEGTAFQGIFDGKGHTISNYGRTISAGLTRRGLFNAVYNATIRNLNIDGSLTITGNGSEAVMIGVVIGDAAGTSLIEDINSSVNITVNNGVVRDLGGVAGALDDLQSKANTTMNRCRYNGKITLTGTQNKAAMNVGGLVGELRSALVKNCLYDGTITVETGVAYESVGGVVGKVGTRDNSEMHRILSHGTITLPAGYAEATNKCGIVVGSADKTIYLYKNYHTTTGCSGLSYIGPHTAIKSVKNEDTGVTSDTEVDQLLGTSTDKTSSLADLKTDAFRTLLGESNWSYAESEYVYPYKDEEHIHKYSNGFCTSGDGEYEKPNSMGKIYQIQNGGQLYWFATHFNNKEIPQDAEVQILKDIDMESNAYIYPGIGTSDYKFKGKFNGLSHSIGRFYRDIVNAEGTGLINYAEDATIEYFSLYGEMHYNLATIKNYHGTVVGLAIGKNTLITDVYSFVDINIQNAYARVVGGIAGRTSGVLRRSRYSGVIAKKSTRTDGKIETTSIEAMASGRQIGGLVANAREEILIEDCLFDGQIWSTCSEAPIMRVSGILASNEKNSGVKITIKNCLFNGCLNLQHTYTEPAGTPHDLQDYTDANGKPYKDYHPDMKQTQNGIIAGYWDSNLPKVVNNVYHMNTCPENNDVPLGNFEGQNQTGTNTIVTTEIKAPEKGETSDVWDSENNQPNWNEIFKALDEYKEVKNEDGTTKVDQDGNPVIERNGNWEYNYDPENPSTTEEIPTPGGHVCLHVKEDETTGESVSAYNEFGYCTICGAAKPLVKDEEDGKYKMEMVSDLASFRDMVNNGNLTAGTVLNAKLTQDIDFSEFDGDFGEPIGNSNFNRYLYNFDGQGYALKNVKITTDDQYVGFFGFAGDETHDCHIHDLTITGEIIVPYKSTDNDDKPMYMGVVGKMYRGRIYNVHSELTMRNTNATRAMIGGIVGCCETKEGNDEHGNPLAVIIDKCSYTGSCYINAAGNFGGILGEASRYTEVKNCTFAGNVHHTYKGSNNTTNFSGIVGYNAEPTFRGVKNCVVAGVLNTDPDRVYVDYGEVGNHKNAVVGEDAILTKLNVNNESVDGITKESYTAQYTNNYAWNVYQPLVAKNSSNIQTYVPQEDFISGKVCAIMNAEDDNVNYNPSDSASNILGHPWGQILGYQKGSGKGGLGINDDGNIEAGPHTTGSPAQRVPLPGYQNPEKKTYKVVKDASNNYTADWYFYDDNGYTTPYPSDAASMKVKRIQYTRAAEYFKGYISMCLPFPFTENMKPAGDSKCYAYYKTEKNTVKFSEITSFPIAAGTPFVLFDTSGNVWNLDIKNNSGTSVALNNPSNLTIENSVLTTVPDANGIYGVFDKTKLGVGYYKINFAGTKLVKTTDDSHCYPFRVFFKLPVPAAESSRYRIVWGDEEEPDGIKGVVVNSAISANMYNLQGQRISNSKQGIVIINGKKVVR